MLRKFFMIINPHRKLSILMILMVFILLPITFFIYKGILPMSAHSLSKYRVVIDPGHGGIDGGTSTPNHDLLEKDINLEVALKVKDILSINGIKVQLTRDEDVSLEDLSPLKASRHSRDLDARRRLIDGDQNTLFVSIHVDAQPKNPNTRGSIIFYYSTSEESKKIAEEIKHSLDRIVYDEFLKDTTLQTQIQKGNYYVLRETQTPGVIVEIGYITNPQDLELLKGTAFKHQMATGISEGIIYYLLNKAQ